MIDIICGLFILTTAAFCWFGLIHCVHWLAQVSCGPEGRRWWFYVATTVVLVVGFSVTMYHGIFGLMKIAFGITTWGY